VECFLYDHQPRHLVRKLYRLLLYKLCGRATKISRCKEGHSKVVTHFRMPNHILVKRLANHIFRRLNTYVITMYKIPAACSLSTIDFGGTPTADTKSFAPLSIMTSTKSSKEPFV
jgi:hypothetical protein